MGRNVFISHSREDIQLVQDLREIFRRSNVDILAMEFEELMRPVSRQIRKSIDESEAMILLLGPNAQNLSGENRFTRDWILWELGVASRANKTIFVFEEVNTEAILAVPDFTDFLIWDREDQGMAERIRQIFDERYYEIDKIFANETPLQQFGLGLSGPSAVITYNLAKLLFKKEDPDVPEVTCEKCKISFRIWSDLASCTCPSCRGTTIQLSNE